MAKTMDDWFLRGGKRPETNGMQETLPEPPDGIPVDDDEEDLDDDDDDGVEDARTFSVTMERTVTVRQTAAVRVQAGCKESAMDRAEDMAEDESGDWRWTDVPGTADYEDCEAVDAKEE